MAEQRSRFWIYFLLFMIWMGVTSKPSTSQVRQIAEKACTSQVE